MMKRQREGRRVKGDWAKGEERQRDVRINEKLLPET